MAHCGPPLLLQSAYFAYKIPPTYHLLSRHPYTRRGILNPTETSVPLNLFNTFVRLPQKKKNLN